MGRRTLFEKWIEEGGPAGCLWTLVEAFLPLAGLALLFGLVVLVLKQPDVALDLFGLLVIGLLWLIFVKRW